MSNCDKDTAVRLCQEIGVINKAPVGYLGEFHIMKIVLTHQYGTGIESQQELFRALHNKSFINSLYIYKPSYIWNMKHICASRWIQCARFYMYFVSVVYCSLHRGHILSSYPNQVSVWVQSCIIFLNSLLLTSMQCYDIFGVLHTTSPVICSMTKWQDNLSGNVHKMWLIIKILETLSCLSITILYHNFVWSLCVTKSCRLINVPIIVSINGSFSD